MVSFVTENIMKPHRIFLMALLAAAPVFALQAAEKSADNARVNVVFLEPQKFTDFRDTYMGDATRSTYADEIRRHLSDQSRQLVPAGHKLEVTFTDIDMAGDFEPWRGPQLTDVRIVKEIYPPRLAFAFRLTDMAGNVVKEGKRDLRDTIFMQKLTLNPSDPIKYEKAMLDDWLRSEFPRADKR